jgi:cysteinyl-tRNA synthetase
MITFYNTLNRKKEEFIPLKEGKVGLYTCGPTVYNYAHVGNFRAYMFEDLLRRFLEFSGFDVHHVMNITDIDDKTIRRANEENVALNVVTDKYTAIFHDDIKTLKILPAHNYPCATDYVKKMINLIEVLEKKGVAYKTSDGSVFFKISEYPEYGKLANLNPDSQKIGKRVVNDEYGKEEARDFALWKAKKEEDGDIFWDSPWGEGRPGWHLECSVMSMDLLGEHFDIHCGGVDNIFPHHENEIAQSCAATNKSFVNVWLHNKHLLVNGDKMSKSLGNFYKIPELIEKGYSAESIRYTLLSTHYRQELNFTFEKLIASQKAINRLRELQRRLQCVNNEANGDVDEKCSKMVLEFRKTLGEDLNISGALGVLFIWVNEFFTLLDKNKISKKSAECAIDTLCVIDSVLNVIECPEEVLDCNIDELIQQRVDARTNKDWAKADEIRDELDELGVVLEDTTNGTIWKRK